MLWIKLQYITQALHSYPKLSPLSDYHYMWQRPVLMLSRSTNKALCWSVDVKLYFEVKRARQFSAISLAVSSHTLHLIRQKVVTLLVLC